MSEEQVERVAQLIGDRIEAEYPVFVAGAWATQLAKDIAALSPPPEQLGAVAMPGREAQEGEALRDALEPVMHWYQSDEHEARPLIDIVRDVVADLQHDRQMALRANRLEDAARRSHDTLIELNPNNYSHDDVCEANDAAVEAILLLADVLGERHGKSESWWTERRALLAPPGDGGEVK